MRRALILLFLAAVMLSSSTLSAAVPKTLVYTGSLKDEKGAPVGGIYWFRYALHRGKADSKMIWSEEMYVAVDKGVYQVELGKERPIPQAIDLTGLWLSVAIDGTEIKREQVDSSMISGGSRHSAEARAAPVDRVCAQCKRADTASNSDRLGGMSVKQLTHSLAKKQIEVGTTSHFTSTAGTGEGTEFRLTCPPGFVVTGLKGKAGDTITNLQLVCSPLGAR